MQGGSTGIGSDFHHQLLGTVLSKKLFSKAFGCHIFKSLNKLSEDLCGGFDSYNASANPCDISSFIHNTV